MSEIFSLSTSSQEIGEARKDLISKGFKFK